MRRNRRESSSCEKMRSPSGLYLRRTYLTRAKDDQSEAKYKNEMNSLSWIRRNSPLNTGLIATAVLSIDLIVTG